MGLPLGDKKNTQHNTRMRVDHAEKDKFPPPPPSLFASSARYLGIPAQFYLTQD